MMMPIERMTWQMLRYILRCKDAHPTGNNIRWFVGPTRKTKDGTYFDKLVQVGLLAVASEPSKEFLASRPPYDKTPIQLMRTYKLTEVGIRAAEYGEYACDHRNGNIAIEISQVNPEANRRRKERKKAREATGRAFQSFVS